MAKQRKTLAEMAAEAAFGSRDRLECPKCGCCDFRTYKTRDGVSSTFRYKQCRHCGHKVLTVQKGERIVRDVDPRDGEETQPTLRVAF